MLSSKDLDMASIDGENFWYICGYLHQQNKADTEWYLRTLKESDAEAYKMGMKDAEGDSKS